ncbi:MAG TPA: hypothetical protein DCY13_03260 [Verrucomicrobiales bacterium]|nr:hypothetical protein [Verrucomicrobiales bacterium]
MPSANQDSLSSGRRFNLRLSLLLALVEIMSAGSSIKGAERAGFLINDRRAHLGQRGAAEWDEFAATPPEADRLHLKFQAQANDREWTLFIRQDDVRHDWPVEINGRRLGKLFLMEADLISSLAVPAGTLQDGENRLAIIPPASRDDIVLNQIRLHPGNAVSAMSEVRLRVSVTDHHSGEPIPARITIVDGNGTLVPLLPMKADFENAPAAVRPGIAYVGPGDIELGLMAGEYTVHASRGFEYGLSSRRVRLAPGDRRQIHLTLRREVPTSGWISCDTHVHTLTHSGHGDATMDERMLTLAGEGIELPIATDHNYHADYRDARSRMEVAEYFTPVTGNEVTTSTAHFNIFPVLPEARVPDFRIGSLPALMKSMRDTPNVRVVVLNHPLNVHNGFQPFAATNFNNVTGEHLRGPEYSFDAMELLNSSAQQSDFMAVYRGWFALLNYGYRITGVGSSDGHDVSRYIVGQGRTYLPVRDDDVGNLEVGHACDALLAGRALVSMGLLVDLQIQDRFRAGDLATNLPTTISLTARVLGPSWVEATNVSLFANGIRLREETITGSAGKPGEKAVATWQWPRPPHDVHLVAIATGPGVTAPHWAIPRPYQPSSTFWEGRVIASTNPIWIDADGDGVFQAARSYAGRLIEVHGTDPTALLPALAPFDEAVAAQVASLCRAAGVAISEAPFTDELRNAAPAVQAGFTAYLRASAVP